MSTLMRKLIPTFLVGLILFSNSAILSASGSPAVGNGGAIQPPVVQYLMSGQAHLLGRIDVSRLQAGATLGTSPSSQPSERAHPTGNGKGGPKPYTVITGSSTTYLTQSPAFGGVPGGSPNPCVCLPPDVNVAVGNTYVVETANSLATVYFKNGTAAKSIYLSNNPASQSLFQSTVISDPQVIYDVQSARWFMTAMDLTLTNFNIKLAVSASSDPTGTWNLYGPLSVSAQDDQPFLGVSNDKIAISVNILSTSSSDYWVFNKADLASGSSSPHYSTGTSSVLSIQPAREYGGTSSPVYMVSLGDSTTNTATYTVVSGLPGNTTVTSSTYTFSVTQTVAPPWAAQKGTSTQLDPGDNRVTSVAWQGGYLWFGASDGCAIGGGSTRSCLRLIQLQTNSTSAPTKLQDFDYAVANTDVYYPGLGVDSYNDLVVLYGASSSSLYPSLYATGRFVGDSANTLWNPIQVVAGSGSMSISDPNHCPDGRYGDYFGAAPDPTSATGVWVSGEYIGTSLSCTSSSSNLQNWSTYIAKESVGACSSISTTVCFVESGLAASTNWSVVFDGTTYSGSSTQIAITGVSSGSHSYSVPIVSCGTGCQYVGSPSSSTLTVNGPTTSSIICTKQYYLTMNEVNNGNGFCGAISPSSSGWRNSGITVTITATWVPPGCSFSGWTGSGSGSYTGQGTITGTTQKTSTATITMNAAITETGTFYCHSGCGQ